MTRSLLGLAMAAAVLGATAARADHDDWGRNRHHDCGPMPTFAPRGHTPQSGHYELQAVQVWVDGAVQQVWVPGPCYQQGWNQVCAPGRYETVQTPGRSETQQQWVWVTDFRPGRPWRHGRAHAGRYW